MREFPNKLKYALYLFKLYIFLFTRLWTLKLSWSHLNWSWYHKTKWSLDASKFLHHILKNFSISTHLSRASHKKPSHLEPLGFSWDHLIEFQNLLAIQGSTKNKPHHTMVIEEMERSGWNYCQTRKRPCQW